MTVTKILDGSLEEIKEAVDEDSDLEALLEAEEKGRDRKEVKRYLRDLIMEGKDHEKAGFDFGGIKQEIKEKLDRGEMEEDEAQVQEQRAPAEHAARQKGKESVKFNEEFIQTGITGLDKMFDKGIPKGLSVIVAGGAGSGKTILSLQILAYHAKQGKKCLYISFEESEERLISHMRDFGWNPDELIESGNLVIDRYSTFAVSRDIEGMLAEQRGELEIDMETMIIPEGMDPDFVVIDSLTAISSAFVSEDASYRMYIEQLFRYLEDNKVTSFLITETKQMPKIFSPTGVEEFLADGVIVMYNIRRDNVRERAIEVLKMRGAKHDEDIVAMQIGGDGITVYPDQEVFGSMR